MRWVCQGFIWKEKLGEWGRSWIVKTSHPDSLEMKGFSLITFCCSFLHYNRECQKFLLMLNASFDSTILVIYFCGEFNSFFVSVSEWIPPHPNCSTVSHCKDVFADGVWLKQNLYIRGRGRKPHKQNKWSCLCLHPSRA